MQDPILVCGREFRPEIIKHLTLLSRQQPQPSANTLARETCSLLAWFGPDGRPALSSAKVALRKLQKREVLPSRQVRSKTPHRLRASGLALARLPQDWQQRYGVTPQLVETFVDRSRFTGLCFGAANWRRVGKSAGRGRLGPKTAVKSLKDVWVFPLHSTARQKLQTQTPRPLTPQPLLESLAQQDWCAYEMKGLDLAGC